MEYNKEMREFFTRE